MLHNLNQLCSDFLNTVQIESDFIINQINTSYKKELDKEKLVEEYKGQINDFLNKYKGTFAGLINNDTKEVLSIDEECSKKLKEIVNRLKNYIADLKE